MGNIGIRSYEVKPYSRKFRTPLITSRQTITERRGFYIKITADNGSAGLGEVGLPIHSFTGTRANDELDQERHNILNIMHVIDKHDVPAALEDAEALIESLFPSIEPYIRFGLETALFDLAARIAGKPLCHMLCEHPHAEIPVNHLIGRPVEYWNGLKQFVQNAGYRAVKIKVGNEPVDNDVKFVKTARMMLRDDMLIRLDANRAWSFDVAIDILNRLKDSNIEYIEEPLDAFDHDLMKLLREKSGIAVALDESLTQPEDTDPVLAHGVCDVLILKPAAHGGISRTGQLAKLAESHGCKTVLTSSLETEIGIAALLHLAASLPGGLYPAGLDTLRLYESRDESLSKVVNGSLKVPAGVGIGIEADTWNRL